MRKVLEIHDLDFTYHTLSGETKAIQNISFDVYENEFLGIIGPSGSGKSTILSLIFGLLTPTSGTITIDQRPSESEETDIGYMLQKDHLFPWRDILSNVSLGLEIQNRLTPKTTARLKEMLSAYGLEGFEHARPSELSGGMRQRAALIRTLALEPDLLLLDEPFSALDYQTRLSVCDDISSILRSTKKTAVLVTHDLSEAISIADRIIILTPRPGRIKKILPIHFPADCATPLKRRNCPEFSGYFNAVWKELKTDE